MITRIATPKVQATSFAPEMRTPILITPQVTPIHLSSQQSSRTPNIINQSGNYSTRLILEPNHRPQVLVSPPTTPVYIGSQQSSRLLTPEIVNPTFSPPVSSQSFRLVSPMKIDSLNEHSFMQQRIITSPLTLVNQNEIRLTNLAPSYQTKSLRVETPKTSPTPVVTLFSPNRSQFTYNSNDSKIFKNFVLKRTETF